jgi:small subunit ribosomal protein S6
MLNRYETVFIANPVLSAPQMKEAVEKFKGLITEKGGDIVHEEDWGLRKLAYPIQKKSTGFYYLIEFNAEGSFINKYETEFKRDERIMRFLTVKLEKYAKEYAEKKRSLKKEAKKEEE